jgi:hypothetical protein
MTRQRKNNSIAGQFIAHSRELRESPAWAALPDNARRVLDRLELEHLRHGGAENGKLKCTYSDFQKAGIRRASVALAIRECAGLGFIEITQRGRRSGCRLPHAVNLSAYLRPRLWEQSCTHRRMEADHVIGSRSGRPPSGGPDQERRHSSKAEKRKPGRANEPEPDAIARLLVASSRAR